MTLMKASVVKAVTAVKEPSERHQRVEQSKAQRNTRQRDEGSERLERTLALESKKKENKECEVEKKKKKKKRKNYLH